MLRNPLGCLVPCWVVSRSLFGPCRVVSCYPVGLPCAVLGWALAGCLSGRVEPCYVRHWRFLCRVGSGHVVYSGRVGPCRVTRWGFLVPRWAGVGQVAFRAVLSRVMFALGVSCGVLGRVV